MFQTAKAELRLGQNQVDVAPQKKRLQSLGSSTKGWATKVDIEKYRVHLIENSSNINEFNYL